jgi:peptidoglycan/xylan/chitin deacetylase (PgdA/CDA1 family)
MNKHNYTTYCAAIAFFCCTASADEIAPASAPASAPISITAAAPATPVHSREEETAHIRHHHLKRLDEKLTSEPKLLEQSCKYESEISTKPPLKRVALTFDDGPEPVETEYILEVLNKHHITAAFFMIGEKAQRHPELVEKVRAAGHQLVGNHSWDHPNFHDISVEEQASQVLRNETQLGNALTPKLFRYPYGNSSCQTNELLRNRGYQIVGWHIDSCDWAFEKTGSVDLKEALSCGVIAQNHHDYIDHVVSAVRARNGGIILMHEIHPNTVRKLDEIVTQLIAEGFVFGSILDEDFAKSMR